MSSYIVGNPVGGTFICKNQDGIPFTPDVVKLSLVKDHPTGLIEETLVYGGSEPYDSQLTLIAVGTFRFWYTTDVVGTWCALASWSHDTMPGAMVTERTEHVFDVVATEHQFIDRESMIPPGGGEPVSVPYATDETGGMLTDVMAQKFAGIPSDAQSAYQVAATASAAASGAVSSIPDGTTLVRGMITTAMVTKLAGVEAGAIGPTAVGVIATNSASGAVSSIPDASPAARGMMTTLQASAAGTIAAVSSTPIPALSGSSTLWSTAVAASTDVTVAARLDCSAYSGDRCSGTLHCVARRVGSGALSVISQAFGAAVELTDPNWDPRFDTDSNTLRLRLTADDSYAISPRGLVQVFTSDTSADDPTPSITVARAAVLADGALVLLYSDTGILEADAVPGNDVTAWANQNTAGPSATFAAGHRAKYRLDGAVPYLEFSTALQVSGTFVGNVDYGDCVYRWTIDAAASGDAEFFVFHAGAELIVIHSGSSYPSSGNKVGVIFDNSGYTIVGTMAEGKHDYELRKTGTTAQFFVDGVGQTPVTFTPGTPASGSLILGSNGAPYANHHMYGFCAQRTAGTDAQMNRWIAMSQMAWGPHD
jgi:hypothetical protein